MDAFHNRPSEDHYWDDELCAWFKKPGVTDVLKRRANESTAKYGYDNQDVEVANAVRKLVDAGYDMFMSAMSSGVPVDGMDKMYDALLAFGKTEKELERQ